MKKLQRRIDNRQKVLSEMEFVVEFANGSNAPKALDHFPNLRQKAGIANRRNAISHEEFVARVCRVIGEGLFEHVFLEVLEFCFAASNGRPTEFPRINHFVWICKP